jgi:hypothetical protein
MAWLSLISRMCRLSMWSFPFTQISVAVEAGREKYCALNWATAHFEPVHGSWELHCGKFLPCAGEAGAYGASAHNSVSLASFSQDA